MSRALTDSEVVELVKLMKPTPEELAETQRSSHADGSDEKEPSPRCNPADICALCRCKYRYREAA